MTMDAVLLLLVVVTAAIKFYHYYVLDRKEDEPVSPFRLKDEKINQQIIKSIELINFVFTISLLMLLIRTLLLHGYIEIDLSLVLVVLLFVTGGIYLLDALFIERTFKLNDPEEMDKHRRDLVRGSARGVINGSRFLFPVVVVVIIVRSFIVEPFKIPSGSMYPTLEIGDFILVNRYAYGLRLPLIHTKILDLGSPKRGDVVVFRYPATLPGQPEKDYIKRVVGLPGDKIRYLNQQLYINGKPTTIRKKATYKKIKYEGRRGLKYPTEYIEQLGDVSHSILLFDKEDIVGRELITGREITVPPDNYFVLGDNRDGSSDSRQWGFVPDVYLKGKAFFIWLSYDGGPDGDRDYDGVIDGMKWSRIGNTIE